NGGIRRRYLRYPREHCSEGGRGTHNLFKHEGLIDLFPERQVLVLQAVFQALDFFKGFLQIGSGVGDFAICRRVLYRDGDLIRYLGKKSNIILADGTLLSSAEA